MKNETEIELADVPSAGERLNVDHHKINNPDWENASRVHDWRNYIPDNIQAIWSELSNEAKAVAFTMASKQADEEEWD